MAEQVAQSTTESVVTVTNQSESSIFSPDKTRGKLEQLIGQSGLPKWILQDQDGKTRTCIECEKPLSWLAVRSVNLCMNAQHIGDIQVEILCQNCCASYFLHYRKECLDGEKVSMVKMFVENLLGKNPQTEPVTMASITPAENNLADEIICDVVASLVECQNREQYNSTNKEDSQCQS